MQNELGQPCNKTDEFRNGNSIRATVINNFEIQISLTFDSRKVKSLNGSLTFNMIIKWGITFQYITITFSICTLLLICSIFSTNHIPNEDIFNDQLLINLTIVSGTKRYASKFLITVCLCKIIWNIR